MGFLRLLLRHKSFLLLCLCFYLLLWFTRRPSCQKTLPGDTFQFKSRSNASFVSLLESVSRAKIDLLLIDPHVLDQLFIRRVSLESISQRWMTFGIVDQSVNAFVSHLQRTNFSVKISSNLRQSPDHLFIEHHEKILHFAVLHKYHSYYLIERNTLSLPTDIQLSFGDTLRIVEPSNTSFIGSDYGFFYPRNVSHFLWLYTTSKFLHCNRTLAKEMEEKFHLYQNVTQWNFTVAPMRSIADGLTLLEKRYWLAGGTLLGWYRHCGLIPFTQDSDFGLYAEEYEESIRTHFLAHPSTYLWGALGLVNDSLEFRLYTGRYTLDLFWAYREDEHRWCGYQVHRAKFRRTLPLLETLCSGDLFGYRFTIPCSPVAYLDAEYGPNRWQSPQEKNYTWINMKYHSPWTDIAWMYAVRLYTRQGKLRNDQYALDWISNHFNYTFTNVPSFINAIPNEPVTLPPLKTELLYQPPWGAGRSRSLKVTRRLSI